MHIERVLVPVKGTQVDLEALTLAANMVGETHGRVHALYVIEVPRQHPVDAELPAMTAKGEETLAEAERLSRSLRCELTSHLLQARDTGPAVVKEAVEQGVDLILMGMPYKLRSGAFSVEATVSYILQQAPCPVLVLREAVPQPMPGTQGTSPEARRRRRA
jgi:nucleotide-binding universal stress UspA family protein